MNNKIAKELDKAFGLISTISVKGNDVDTMAAARQCMRNAYSMLTAPEANDENGVKEEPANGG